MSLLNNLLVPSGVAYALFVLGLIARIVPPIAALSWWLLMTSGAITVTFSTGMVAAALMSPLEYSHARIESPLEHPEAKHIVVLTAWAADDANMPLSGRLNAAALYRVSQALELYHARPDCDILISGSEPAARLMMEVLREFGVPQERIWTDGESDSTAQSAAALELKLAQEPFFLVTSAGHLPRAIGLLEARGLKPIAAPTDFQLPKDWRYAEWKPTPLSLTVTDLAVHEYSALLWYKLRNVL